MSGAKFHQKVELVQPFAHSGVVDFAAIRPDYGAEPEADSKVDWRDYTAVVVYTGACNVTMRVTSRDLRRMAALLTAAAESMEREVSHG